jgi:hypothetical protein
VVEQRRAALGRRLTRNQTRNTAFEQRRNHVGRDVAGALHRDRLAVEIARFEPRQSRLDGADHPRGGHRRRIPRATEVFGDAGGEARVLEQHAHIVGLGSDILRCHITSVKTRHEAAVLSEDPASARRVAQEACARIGDHALAAAPPEPGERALPTHPLREAQAVAEEVASARVAPAAETALPLSAQRVVEEGAVERTALRAHLEEDGFVPVVVGLLGQRARERLERGQ